MWGLAHAAIPDALHTERRAHLKWIIFRYDSCHQYMRLPQSLQRFDDFIGWCLGKTPRSRLLLLYEESK